MLRHSIPGKRRGAVLTEFALVLPIVVLLIFGLLVGALGVFRYQQVATLAREAARYASVHGGQFQKEGWGTAATPAVVYSNAIQAQAVALDPNHLSYAITWDHPSKAPLYYDDAAQSWRTNRVRVTVTYAWIPQLFFGNVNLTSTSVMPMSF
jgi:Flp pilus assembly protein TadG